MILNHTTGDAHSPSHIRRYYNAYTGYSVYQRRVGRFSFGGLDDNNLSRAGFSFLLLLNPGLDILAAYRDTVALADSTPAGDTFRFFDVAFTNPGKFATGDTLAFVADTDLLGIPGDIAPVPEPGTFVLWTTAFVTMLGYRWRCHRPDKRALTSVEDDKGC